MYREVLQVFKSMVTKGGLVVRWLGKFSFSALVLNTDWELSVTRFRSASACSKTPVRRESEKCNVNKFDFCSFLAREDGTGLFYL